jgi:hypothetical protein
MPSSLIARALLVAPLLSAACAAPMRPPVQNGGPALSAKGIEVAVLRQGCAQADEPDAYGFDLIEEQVEIQVRNGAPDPATVHRDRFRLLAPDGSALATTTWRSADPLTVAGGQTEIFDLRFMTRGGLACTEEMRLDPASGVTLHESPVALRPLPFVPTRGL